MSITNLDLRVVHNITKEYPEMIKVVIYREPKAFVVRSGLVKRDKKDVEEDYSPTITSLYRTKTLVQDIVLCNDFELFCTFTFDPNKIDRYNYGRCRLAISTWLHHQKDRSRSFGKDFRYLVVPEQHKDGAWHFHALLSGYVGSLHDSKLRTKSDRPIYNISSFRGGFTTAVHIDDKQAVSSYVTKYISKDFIKKFNQRRFICSKNLTRPKREINSFIFRRTPPLFRRKVSENLETEQFILPVFY